MYGEVCQFLPIDGEVPALETLTLEYEGTWVVSASFTFLFCCVCVLCADGQKNKEGKGRSAKKRGKSV